MYLVRHDRFEGHSFTLHTGNVIVVLSEKELVDFYKVATLDLTLWGILPGSSDNHLVPPAPE